MRSVLCRVCALYFSVFKDFVGGRCCNSSNWPGNVIEFFAHRVTGMVGIVGSIPYTIGYAAFANIQGFAVRSADLVNHANKRTSPTTAAVQVRYRNFLII